MNKYYDFYRVIITMVLRYRYAIHYTAYATEGRRYVPWLGKQLQNIANVEFREQKVSSVKEVGRLKSSLDNKNIAKSRLPNVKSKRPLKNNLWNDWLNT